MAPRHTAARGGLAWCGTSAYTASPWGTSPVRPQPGAAGGESASGGRHAPGRAARSPARAAGSAAPGAPGDSGNPQKTPEIPRRLRKTPEDSRRRVSRTWARGAERRPVARRAARAGDRSPGPRPVRPPPRRTSGICARPATAGRRLSHVVAGETRDTRGGGHFPGRYSWVSGPVPQLARGRRFRSGVSWVRVPPGPPRTLPSGGALHGDAGPAAIPCPSYVART